MIEENNTRQGFIEDEEFERLKAAASDLFMRVLLELAYTYSWRRSELLGLRVRQVNLVSRTIRLDPGTTKNKEGREVVMTGKVETLLRAAVAGKRPDDHVITWDRGRSKGKPVRDFRDAWAKLFRDAGVEAKLLHDMRRSGVKALRRAGVPESVIMATSGMKSNSIFRRYAIVSSADQRQAIELLELARERNRIEAAKALLRTPSTDPLEENAAGTESPKLN